MQTAMPTFSGRLAFILVAAGSAIGLGNIWAFPFVAGMNGGGGFVLIYLIALGLIAAPALLAEMVLGRLGRASPPETLRRLQEGAVQQGRKVKFPPWSFFGWVGTLSNVVILSFYAVIAGQALAYAWFSWQGEFTGVDLSGVYGIDATYKASLAGSINWTIAFIAITSIIVAFDIRAGIEKAGKILMPALFVILLILVGYAAVYGDMGAAFDFLFGFENAHIDSTVIMQAVGQAFFTLSVGVGGLMMYAAYMGENVDLPKAALWIVLLDLSIALLAGFAIFPLVFSEGVDPAAGPALIFITLPTLFGKLPGGDIFATLFFLLLTFAALTSAISMTTSIVAKMEEKGWRRWLSSSITGCIAFALSLLTIFSFGPMADLYPLGDIIPRFDQMTWFDLLREGVNNIILPIGALAFVCITGWGVNKTAVAKALEGMPSALQSVIFVIWRYLVPVTLLVMIGTLWT